MSKNPYYHEYLQISKTHRRNKCKLTQVFCFDNKMMEKNTCQDSRKGGLRLRLKKVLPIKKKKKDLSSSSS